MTIWIIIFIISIICSLIIFVPQLKKVQKGEVTIFYNPEERNLKFFLFNLYIFFTQIFKSIVFLIKKISHFFVFWLIKVSLLIFSFLKKFVLSISKKFIRILKLENTLKENIIPFVKEKKEQMKEKMFQGSLYLKRVKKKAEKSIKKEY